MAEGDGRTVNKLCKYCRKSVVVSNPKNTQCVNCESLLHPSYARRVKALIKVNEQKNLVKSCEKGIPDKSEIICDFPTMEVLKVETSCLKMLLEEKNFRINELIKIIELFEYNIAQKTFGNSITDLVKQAKDGSNSINEHVVTTKFKNAKELINEQKRILNEVINLEIDRPDVSQEGTDKSWNVRGGRYKQRRNMNEELRIYNNRKESRMDETSNIQDGFSENTLRNKKRSPKTITKANQYETRGSDTVSAEDSFRAEPSKMRLYVGSAMTSFTGPIVKDFMVSKCIITEVILGNFSASQVGIDPAYFEAIYQAEFWPQGSIVSGFHFDFKKIITTGKNNFFLFNPSQGTAMDTTKLE
ncbi:hypothetical protein WA026_019639 [Henosepilachna vigintioctopunctata]|uniref:Uncharacterized protein n=1 Tax=Henosepilachna vigintioctopunctata TaxID=420089 RepID=A0AAW1TW64_9CUCU